VGSKYPCRDYSFTLGNNILRSVNLSSVDKPTSIYRLVTWIAPDGAKTFVLGQVFIANWGITLTITSYAASIAVNTLVTGLIVFRILKVFLEVTEVTEVERTLGSTGGTTLRHIMFVIIESGMMLFAIQLVRLVLEVQPKVNALSALLIGIIQMFNVIIRSVHFILFVLLMTFTWLGHHTNTNFAAGLNETVL
jgi:hypothetical protein